MKAGVPTVSTFLEYIHKTKAIITTCHMLVFIENPYIMGSCLFAAALVCMLSKKALLSSHS